MTRMQEARSGDSAPPMMSNRRKGYVAYLLRLWQVGEGENAWWRASLETPQTAERRGFASLDDLFEYLLARTGAVSEPRARENKKCATKEESCQEDE